MTPQEILKKYKRIAVVGISPNPERPSHYVTEHMIEHGYEVEGVNPGHSEILGRPCRASLREVTGPLEIVNVFRASEYVKDVIDEAIPLKPKVIWLQLGIHDEAAEAKARAAGIEVVTDHCIMVEERKLR